mmetsp:Transcript_11041/g.8174  ORF Transcript_11041/g.8174 Transcript_11041/m.8174 type:complete len:88 (-) Transcript_11041:16-279(-)
MSLNIPLQKEDSSLDSELLNQIKLAGAQVKLGISKCNQIARNHCLLKFNEEKERYEIMALQPTYLSNQLITKDSGYVELKPLSQLHF